MVVLTLLAADDSNPIAGFQDGTLVQVEGVGSVAVETIVPNADPALAPRVKIPMFMGAWLPVVAAEHQE